MVQFFLGLQAEKIDFSQVFQAKNFVPDELGIFLERTFRMHPGVCEPLSKVVYEGKLVSDAATQNQAIVIPKPESIHRQNGVIWLPVAHEGNTQCSQEEVDHIKKLIKELLTGTYQDKDQQILPMTENDILVVAPYNMQVNLLKEQLLIVGYRKLKMTKEQLKQI